MTSGIYTITNIVNGKFYLGSTGNLRRRFCDHKNLLRKGAHKNPHLQLAWNFYGEDSFVFEVLHLCEVVRLSKIEQSLLTMYVGLAQCYNVARFVDNPTRGRLLSASHRAKLRGPRGTFPSMSTAKLGNSNALRRLSDVDVRTIRQEYVPYKVSATTLAKRYGVSSTMIWLIVHNKTRVGL